MITILTIQCGERLCAIEHTAVREIAPIPHLSQPPSLPPAVEGLLNFGGAVVVVVDLARLLGVTPNPAMDPLYRHILVLKEGGLALLVDRVENIRQVSEDAIRAVDPQSSINGCVRGQTDLDGATISLLDANRIFLTVERVRLAEIQRAEQARLDALAVG